MKKKMLFVVAMIVAFTLFVPGVMAAENVAKIGETEYATLAEAIAAVGSETTTITLISDVEMDVRFDIPAGKTVVLDMAGHTMDLLLVEDNYASVIKGSLTIKGNGTINVPGPFGIYVTGSLTIENGTFNQPEGTYLIFNYKDLTINGGVFNADYCAVNGYRGNPVTINGGTFNGNEPELIVGEVQMVVNGGVFNQDIMNCKFVNEAQEEVYCLTNSTEKSTANIVETDDGVYAEAEETVTVTFVEVVDGKVGEKESLVLLKGISIDKAKFEKELKTELKKENMYLLNGFYADKKLKTKFDFTKELNKDITMYISVISNPKTGDVNLAVIIGTILVGLAGAFVVLRKRFAKSN